jgi:ergothioneine biosynthesis protein EgtB
MRIGVVSDTNRLTHGTRIAEPLPAEDAGPPRGESPPTPQRYGEVRARTEALCAPLAAEDYVVQSMPDASPAKWHLAHTTWYFETFVLARLPDHRAFDPAWGVLFNSYYNTVGEQFPRPERGLLSRPTVEEVLAYRRHVDARLCELLAGPRSGLGELSRIVELGLHHEQQHQELLLTDLKHLFSRNPLRPGYHARDPGASEPAPGRPSAGLAWVRFPEAIRWVGHDGRGFAFDNEGPRHRRIVPAFELATRLVSCGEYLAFLAADGYARPELWMSDGWNAVQQHGWRAPLYWEPRDGGWWQMTLHGMRPVAPEEPVCHVSWYEADAYARFAGARLPGEEEWEAAAQDAPVAGNFVESERLHPASACAPGNGIGQIFGDVWEWTRSPYEAYPGYVPPAGAIGEYNGKFMCNQFVLRGGSCATPQSHIRSSYRNFFPPDARWQFSGIRLARWA